MNQQQAPFKSWTDAEQKLRVQLAAAYRMVDLYGWSELIYSHLTVRVPGPEHHFLINPYGLTYDEVTASNLVKVDLDGRIVGPSKYGVNPAGFVIHSAIHAQSEDNNCVMHTHSTAGMALAALQDPLRPLSIYAASVFGHLSIHEFEGISTDPAERERLVQHFGANRSMILRNHGLLVAGRTVPETFLRLFRLERACTVQLAALSAGPVAVMNDKLAAHCYQQVEGFSQQAGGKPHGETEFDALVRKLDRIDPNYRD